MMTRARKAEEITTISDRFAKAKAAFLVDFKGMNVEQVTLLRKNLRNLNAEMKVVRNTLAIRALKEQSDIEPAFADHFVGTNAVVFAYEDATAPAKALSEFMKDVEQLVIKSGVMEGKVLDEGRIKYLATLPSKDVLRAQFLGVLQAPMSKFLGTLDAVPSGFARVLGAKKAQLEG